MRIAALPCSAMKSGAGLASLRHDIVYDLRGFRRSPRVHCGRLTFAGARHRRHVVHLQRDLGVLIAPYPYANPDEIFGPQACSSTRAVR